MQPTWDLSVFYHGFDDPALRVDIDTVISLTREGEVLLRAPLPELEKLEKIVAMQEKLGDLLSRAYLYCQLTLSVEAENPDAFRVLQELDAVMVDTQVLQSGCTRLIGAIADLDALIAQSQSLTG